MSDPEDLEDELLMAAGQRGGYSDDSSSDEREEQTANKRKRAASRRKDDDDDLSSDGGNDDDLYEDEEDKRKLEAMTELQREMILEERAVARDRKRQRKQLQKQLQRGKASKSKGKDDKTVTEVRASSRRAREVTDKDRAMDRLFAAREARGARRTADGSDDGDESMSGEEDRGGSDADDESREEDDADDEEDDIVDTREDRDGGDEDDEVTQLEDLQQIQVRRTLLEKWFHQPFFEECMQGVIVRCGCGERVDPVMRKQVPNYILFDVEEVVTERGGKALPTYKFGPNHVKTNKWLHLRDGKDEQYMQMSVVSNQPLTQQEVDTWTTNLKRSKRPMLQRTEFQKIKENIEKAEKYKYTSEDVQKILEQKRAKGAIPANFILERIKLAQRRENAFLSGNYDEAERLDQLIAEMDTKFSEDKQNRMRAQGMSSVNRRNKEYNSAMSLKQSASGPRPQLANGKLANAVDVFSRRSTRSRIYWRTSTKDGEENEQAIDIDKLAVEEAEKLSKSQQSMDPVELLKELNLDIDVSIVKDLQQLQHPLPRKLLGNKWQESLSTNAHMDLSNKTLLSVADWKERADALQG